MLLGHALLSSDQEFSDRSYDARSSIGVPRGEMEHSTNALGVAVRGCNRLRWLLRLANVQQLEWFNRPLMGETAPTNTFASELYV